MCSFSRERMHSILPCICLLHAGREVSGVVDGKLTLHVPGRFQEPRDGSGRIDSGKSSMFMSGCIAKSVDPPDGNASIAVFLMEKQAK